MNHVLITSIEASGLLAALVPMAAVVGLLGIVALVVRFSRDRASATHRWDR